MNADTLLEIISGVHLSSFVDSPFKEHGGLMLVAPPSSLKSAFEEVIDFYRDAIILTDLNQQTLISLREDISAHKLRTLCFLDYEKLYQRHPNVSSNLEGSLKALVAEGFHKAAFEEQRMATIPARATVIAAMTRNFYARKYGQWYDDGFARRFLWCHYVLESPHIVTRAIMAWQKLQFAGGYGFTSRVPETGSIPYDMTDDENEFLAHMMKDQPSDHIGLILLKKVFCALLWKFQGNRGLVLRYMQDFAPSLAKHGTTLTFASCIVPKHIATQFTQEETDNARKPTTRKQ